MRRVETPQARCVFGLSRGDITPPLDIYFRMWGAAKGDRATGVHRPLLATVAALRPAPVDANDGGADGGDARRSEASRREARGETAEKLLIALDHCLLGGLETRQFLERVSARAGAPIASLLVTFSHTHAAGLMSLDRVSLRGGELIPAYLEELARRVADLATQARAAARPAAVVFGRGRCALAAHRDYWDEETNQYVCGYNPDHPAHDTDDAVLAARVTGEDGAPLATLVNYACHPTTLAWQNTLISPDFPGATRELVERETGAPCLFLQGASGELGPVEGFVGDVAVAERNGRELGYAALSALAALPPAGTRFEYRGPVVSGATIGAWERSPLGPRDQRRLAAWRTTRRVVPLAYRADLPNVAALEADRQRHAAAAHAAQARGDALAARDQRALEERCARTLHKLAGLPEGAAYPFVVEAWRLGDGLLLAVEGEPYSALQTRVRERFPTTPILVLSLAGGWGPSYLPPAATYGKGVYQESVALLAPGCLEQVIEAAIEVVRAALADDA